MRRALALAAVLASQPACEAIVGISDKIAPADGGGQASAEGGPEGGTPDAGGEDPDVPCMQQPTNLFCDDFDSQASIKDGWTYDDPTDGATIAFDTVDYVSPSRSAQFIAPTTTMSQAQLGVNLASVSTGFRMAFDLRVDVADLTGLPQIGVVEAIGMTNGLTLIYVLADSGASIQAYVGGGGAPMTLPLPPPPTRTWTRLVLVYDLAQGLTVIEDGKTLTTSTMLALGAPGPAQFIIGVSFVNPSPPYDTPFQVEIDNVVVRAQP